MTSPNAGWIPEVNLEVHETFARYDGFYGPDEYLFVPQFADQKVPHIVCIPRAPTSNTDDLAGHEYMFNALRDDTVEDAYPGADGQTGNRLVRIAMSFLTRVLYSIDAMAERGNALISFIRQHNPHHIQQTPQIEELINRMRRNYHRFEIIPTTLFAAKFLYADICRAWLEIAGLDNWYRKFRQPVQDFTVGPASNIANVVGAYTTDEGTVAAFLRMGVPVWFIQPYSTFRDQIIRAESPIFPVAHLGVLNDNFQPRPGFIFKGSYQPTADRYHAIKYNSRVFFTTPDAYSVNSLTAAQIPAWMSAVPTFPEGTRQVEKYTKEKKKPLKQSIMWSSI